MTATPAAFADDRGTVGDIGPALYTDVLQPGSGCALLVPAALCYATQDREIPDDDDDVDNDCDCMVVSPAGDDYDLSRNSTHPPPPPPRSPRRFVGFQRAFEMASEYNRELKDYSIVATAWLAKLQSEPPRAVAMRMLQEDIEAFLLEVTTFMSTTHDMFIDLPPEPIDYTELSCSWGSQVTRFRQGFQIVKDALDSEEG